MHLPLVPAGGRGFVPSRCTASVRRFRARRQTRRSGNNSTQPELLREDVERRQGRVLKALAEVDDARKTSSSYDDE